MPLLVILLIVIFIILSIRFTSKTIESQEIAQRKINEEVERKKLREKEKAIKLKLKGEYEAHRDSLVEKYGKFANEICIENLYHSWDSIFVFDEAKVIVLNNVHIQFSHIKKYYITEIATRYTTYMDEISSKSKKVTLAEIKDDLSDVGPNGDNLWYRYKITIIVNDLSQPVVEYSGELDASKAKQICGTLELVIDNNKAGGVFSA